MSDRPTHSQQRAQALPLGLPAGKPFALLLPRGRCAFELKAAAAEAAGASLVVIYNNEEVRPPVYMYIYIYTW